jgi:hypothetical protein
MNNTDLNYLSHRWMCVMRGRVKRSSFPRRLTDVLLVGLFLVLWWLVARKVWL